MKLLVVALDGVGDPRPLNMAICNPIAMNLMAATRTKSSLKVRRKRAGWNPGYLEDILNGIG